MMDLYPTRHGGDPAILPRRDPVAWGPYRAGAPISEAQYLSWCEKGYLLMDGQLSQPEVGCLSREIGRLRSDDSIRALPEAITEPDTGELRSLFAPHRHSEMIAALARDPRLLGIAEFLLGGPVYIHQARVNYKPGLRGGAFYWHSDFETWHAEDGLPRIRTLSISVALTDNTQTNGPLMLMPGSHRKFVSCPEETPHEYYKESLKRQTVGTPDAESLEKLSGGGIELAVGEAGMLTIFDANVMHGSPGNLTPWPRSNVFFVYNSVENLPVAPYCGRPPRPWFVAEREDFTPLAAEWSDYRAIEAGEAGRGVAKPA